MIQLQRPSECPDCRGKNIQRILYGLPGPSMLDLVKRGEAVLGGCFVQAWSDDWRCAECKNTWHLPDDPGKIELERLHTKFET